MDLPQFERLNLHTKIRVILNHGEYIEEIPQRDITISLYSLNLFFVEVISKDGMPPRVLEINGFDDGKKLDRYTLRRFLKK